MPDLMSHLLIGLILAELLGVRKKSLIALGSILPDIMSKFYLIYFHLGLPAIVSFVSLHTPLMALLFSIILAPFCMYNKTKTVILINIGAMSHFLSDITMRHFEIVGTRLFFPFSTKNYTLNLIWPEQSFFVLLFCSVAYFIIIFAKKKSIIKSFINLIRK